MIVWNHGRRWFAMQADALAWRRKTANPIPVVKVRVMNREALAALLDALCEPSTTTSATPADAALIERAFVPVETDVPDCVPRFLLDAEGQKEWDKRHLK